MRMTRLHCAALLIGVSVLLAPLHAQTTATQTTATAANQTMGINPNPPSMQQHGAQSTSTSTKKVTTSMSHTHHKVMHHSISRVYADSTRLQSILADVTTTALLSPAVWKSTANEASSLATRIRSQATGKAALTAATSLRTHVREMRTAALSGDTGAAKTHAAEALPFAHTLVAWSAPKP